jgi:nitrogen regulatory protein P-II 1
MKKIEATINPFELDELKQELVHAGIDAMSVSEVRSADGSTKTRLYRGAAYAVDLHPRLKVEILLEDGQLSACIDAFVRCAKARAVSGEIMIAPVDDSVRIRTGEHLVRPDRAAHAA